MDLTGAPPSLDTRRSRPGDAIGGLRGLNIPRDPLLTDILGQGRHKPPEDPGQRSIVVHNEIRAGAKGEAIADFRIVIQGHIQNLDTQRHLPLPQIQLTQIILGNGDKLGITDERDGLQPGIRRPRQPFQRPPRGAIGFSCDHILSPRLLGGCSTGNLVRLRRSLGDRIGDHSHFGDRSPQAGQIVSGRGSRSLIEAINLR